MRHRLKWIVKKICGVMGHVWIRKRLADHNTTYENYIDVKRCKRCGTWDYNRGNK